MGRNLLALAGAAACIALFLLGPAAIAMEPDSIRSTIQQARDAWITGNAAAFADLFTRDGEFVVPGRVYRGREAIRAAAAEFSQGHSGVAIQLHRLLIDGDRAVVEWRWQDTETATGIQTQADDAIVVEFAAGQISRWREYIDSETPKSESVP